MLNRIALPILFIGLLMTTAVTAQVKIGDDPQTIDANSLLELQSNDKVLVITRVDSLQMTNIVPNRGALVYNTTANCVYYYNGTQWVNLCDGSSGNLTADPLVNDISTIVITQTENGSNFEIAPNSINSEQIVNGGINGVDIQDGSIGQGKLQNNSVTQDKLSENSVGAFALDNDNINLSDFTNDEGFITNADIISGDAGNVIQAGSDNGAFYDDSLLQAEIDANTAANTADTDQSPTNELQNLSISGDQLSITNGNTITIPTSNGSDTRIIGGTNTQVAGNGTIATPYQINVTGVDTDTTNEIQDITFNTTTNVLTISNNLTTGGQVDLSSLAGGGGSTEVVDGITLTGIGTGADPFKIEPSTTTGQFLSTDGSGNVVWANVPATGATPALSQVLTTNNSAGNLQIKDLQDPTVNQDAATKAYVDATVASGGALTDGSILIGGTGDVAQQLTISGDAAMDNAGVLTIQNDSITSLKIKDGTIALEDFSNMGADTDGQIMRWSETNGQWEIASAASHTGQSKSLFFADVNGDPAQAFHPTNGNPSLIWDYDARVVSGRAYGALGIGLDGQAINNNTKVHIIDNVGGNTSFPLEIQNRQESAGSAVGILFANDRFNDGKGAIIFQRTGNFGVGDFHFVLNQNNTGREAPQLTSDKAFTIKNNGDIQLYGNLIARNGAGSDGQVLTTNAAGETVWGAGGVTNSTFAVTDTDSDGTDDSLTLTDSDGTSLSVALSSINSGSDTTNASLTVSDTDADGDDDTLTLTDSAGGTVTIALADINSGSDTTNASLTVSDTDADGDDDTLTLTDSAGGTVTIALADINSGNDTTNASLTVSDTDADGDDDTLTLTDSAGGTVTIALADINSGSDTTNASLTVSDTDADGDDDTLTLTDSAGGTVTIALADINSGSDTTNASLTVSDTDADGDDDTLTLTDSAGGTVTIALADINNVSPQNIGNSNLTLEANRTLDLDGFDLSFDTGGGNIGIGGLPGAPQSQLDVNGSIRTRNGFLAPPSTIAGGPSNPSYGFYTESGIGMFRAGVTQLAFATGGIEVIRIDDLQNVGIGTDSPVEKLHVAGNIRADGNFISNNTTIQVPDYVFQKYYLGTSELKESYHFSNLEEVEAFIKKNHHLPGVTSAVQAEENGHWNLSASNLQNLEKIEELFLHTIAQEKEINRLKAEKEALANEVQAMKKDLEEIKSLLQK
ncbi:hypothetical protein D1013_06035 [Euzebyella marina]|uniref:Peptidase S74 domain-containing protein n=1 Tax=Euzebyella marina TaxID=1761453 RepID=A0A3G2L400_9FLAO|nr:hypothetical protein [Euzebyella marina]AYN66963.1 hypothetical protein D1013_06035 [Euzebyella marina]